MKSIKNTSLVLALLLVAGCATTFRPWKLSDVQEGMDRDQVVKILGQPDSVEMKDGVEFLYYNYSENYNPTTSSDSVQAFEADRKAKDDLVKQSAKEYRYSVKMVEGKVQSYAELAD